MHLNDHRFRFFSSSSVFCFFSFLFFFSRTRESYAYCVFFGIVSNNILSPLVFKMCRHVLDRAKKFICLCFLGAFSVFFLPLSLSLFCFSLTYFLLLLLNGKKKSVFICFVLLQIYIALKIVLCMISYAGDEENINKEFEEEKKCKRLEQTI